MTALADILDMPEATRPVLDPAIYVEPNDRDPAPERKRQSAFVTAVKKHPGFVVAAYANGAKRSAWEARTAKAEGLMAGMPDTAIYWADGHALIEFKDGDGKPSPAQIETLNWLHLRGHAVAICRTAKGAMDWLKSIGAPL